MSYGYPVPIHTLLQSNTEVLFNASLITLWHMAVHT